MRLRHYISQEEKDRFVLLVRRGLSQKDAARYAADVGVEWFNVLRRDDANFSAQVADAINDSPKAKSKAALRVERSLRINEEKFGRLDRAAAGNQDALTEFRRAAMDLAAAGLGNEAIEQAQKAVDDWWRGLRR